MPPETQGKVLTYSFVTSYGFHSIFSETAEKDPQAFNSDISKEITHNAERLESLPNVPLVSNSMSTVAKVAEEPPSKRQKTETETKLLSKHVASSEVLPNMAIADSDYLFRLQSAVGIPATQMIKESEQKLLAENELSSTAVVKAADSENTKTGLDMSIVKIEKENEEYEIEGDIGNNDSEFNVRSREQTENVQKAEPSESDIGSQFDHYFKWRSQSFPGLSFVDQGAYLGSASGCERMFAKGNMLTPAGLGMAAESSPKVFKCQFCDKEFREKTNLRVHLRTHTGEKPYRCGICGKDFAHSSNLKQHERGVHKLPPRLPQYKQHFYNELSRIIDGSVNTGSEVFGQSAQERDGSGSNGAELIAQPVQERSMNQPVFPGLDRTECETERVQDIGLVEEKTEPSESTE